MVSRKGSGKGKIERREGRRSRSLVVMDRGLHWVVCVRTRLAQSMDCRETPKDCQHGRGSEKGRYGSRQRGDACPVMGKRVKTAGAEQGRDPASTCGLANQRSNLDFSTA